MGVRLVLAALFVLLAMPASAQTEQGVSRILVIGDALAGGLGAGLLRLSAERPGHEVSLRFNEESGLARPEIYDWAATLPKILEGGAYDVIVVMLGANDRQLIRQGGQQLEFGSPAWQAAYRRQIDRLLDELQASGARVIWVSLPPMQDAAYDKAIGAIMALQREQIDARGLDFLDLRPSLSAPGGGFAETVQDPSGAPVRLRGRDGISFFKAGNNLMASLVLAAIAKPAPAAAATAEEPDQASLAGVPVFGQAMIGQPPYTVQPEGVTANVMLLAQGGLDPQTALKTLRDISPPGSGADLLFRLGEALAAPAGRADDFAAPPPAP